MHWIGVDVGGTFTDVVVYEEGTGVLDVAKSPTTRADPTVGLLNALGKLSASLSEAGRVVCGTTIGTNAILERMGAPVWMITTRGFRDTLEIALDALGRRILGVSPGDGVEVRHLPMPPIPGGLVSG